MDIVVATTHDGNCSTQCSLFCISVSNRDFCALNHHYYGLGGVMKPFDTCPAIQEPETVRFVVVKDLSC